MVENSNPQPLGGNQMPRFGGIATFMRLPGDTSLSDLDVAVVGVPFDIGTSNRPGARFGPRGIRDESVLLRPYNMATRAAPFDSLKIDDTGDVASSPFDLSAAVEQIEDHFIELPVNMLRSTVSDPNFSEVEFTKAIASVAGVPFDRISFPMYEQRKYERVLS